MVQPGMSCELDSKFLSLTIFSMSETREQTLQQLEEEFFFFLWKFKERTSQLLKGYGLKPDQMLLLEMIARGIAHPKNISDAMQWDPPLLSHYLAKLESKGLIKRSLDQKDRRRTNVTITDEGLELLDKARNTWHEYTKIILNTLSPDELSQMLNILRRILDTEAQFVEANDLYTAGTRR